MYDDHPYTCKKVAYPTKCKTCGSEVIYWECLHNSKVIFDPPDLGVHNCSSGSSLPPSAWSLDYERPEPGMRLGLKRFPPEIARWMEIAKGGESESNPRNIVRVPPLAGERRTVVGNISNIIRVDLQRKFDLGQRVLLANHLAETFPGHKVVQVTLVVDDILNDVANEDFQSFTVWYPENIVSDGVNHQESIKTTIFGVKLLVGDRWIGESIERL